MRMLFVALALTLAFTNASAAQFASSYYCKSIVTGKFISRDKAMHDPAHARCVPPIGPFGPVPTPTPVPPAPVPAPQPAPVPQPPAPPAFMVIRWPSGSCEVWVPPVPVTQYTMIAQGESRLEAWAKMQSLYVRGTCQ